MDWSDEPPARIQGDPTHRLADTRSGSPRRGTSEVTPMTTNDFTPTQVMMTLSTLAAIAYEERPSGEPLATQQQRILAGINNQLADTSIATAGLWTAIWVGLSGDRANLAYIAQGPTSQYAVVIRGTMGGTPIDTAEDMQVGVMMPFIWSGMGNISQGAMEAFTEVTSAKYRPSSGKPTNLLEALTALVDASSSPLTIYVTGHSLGGATATTVSLFLDYQQTWSTRPIIQLYTFAAPTAGDAKFASAVNQLGQGQSPAPPPPVCVYNAYDVVPNAWWNLEAVKSFYPMPPGPSANVVVKTIISDLITNDNIGTTNVYVQPTLQPPLNPDYAYYDSNYVGGGIGGAPTKVFIGQATCQHASASYLYLLSAPAVTIPVPTVTGNGGATSSGTITINGTGFTPDSTVDFGTLPGSNVVVVSDTTITVTPPSFAGVVDVRVTNMNGTSAAGPADWYPPVKVAGSKS